MKIYLRLDTGMSNYTCFVFKQVRSHLMALHPDNFRNLEIIQQSQMSVVFDDASPESENEASSLL